MKLTDCLCQLLSVFQRTVAVQVGIQVVGTAFTGVVGQVEDGQCGGRSAVVALIAEGEKFPDIPFTDVEVGQLVEVALDVAGCQRR